MIIKVCGITTLEDADLAVELGATALGFNFYPPSPRFIEPRHAEALLAEIPSTVLKVGVYVGNPHLPPPPLRAVQLHGFSHQDEIRSQGHRIIVATSAGNAAGFPDYEIIIDTSWGSGKLADWGELEALGRPFILSGGLTPDNVADAILKLNPAGVDVCSGIESRPGRKDPKKMRRFMEAVREGIEELEERGRNHEELD